MLSLIKRHRLILTAIALLAGSVFVLEREIELTGALLFIASILIAIYIILLKFLSRNKPNHTKASWIKTETTLLLSSISIICFIGIFESGSRTIWLTVLFAEILALITIYVYLLFRNKNAVTKSETIIKKWGFFRFGFWVLGIMLTVILIIAAVLENESLLSVLDPFYFIYLFVVFIDWIVRHIQSTIKLKTEKTKTELMHLKSQVNPHFFFNMLNNLYGLVGKDTKKAQELILQLSDMMRYSIYEGEKDSVTLKEEIDYLKNYLELHKMRYHKLINVEFDIDIDNEGYKIAPLLLIMLLENAFKHGVENLTENAYVKIILVVQNKQISFEVENNYDASQLSQDTGIGLKNLKRRLELIYPIKHVLQFQAIDNVYNAKLKIDLA